MESQVSLQSAVPSFQKKRNTIEKSLFILRITRTFASYLGVESSEKKKSLNKEIHFFCGTTTTSTIFNSGLK